MHRTSDRGRIDQHNRLVVVGRVDDVVQVGGINVSVAAVEGAVQEHPMVAEAAVVAVADDQWGSKITAFVVANGLESVSDQQLIASIVERAANALGAESRPRDIVLMDSLPTLPTGKIDREQLRSLAAQS